MELDWCADHLNLFYRSYILVKICSVIKFFWLKCVWILLIYEWVWKHCWKGAAAQWPQTAHMYTWLCKKQEVLLFLWCWLSSDHFWSNLVLSTQMCEKEKLLSERNQLKVCMSELWQNLSFLSQQVCREVQQGSQPPPVSTSIDLTSTPPSPSSDDVSSQPRSPVSRQREAACLSDAGGEDGRCRVEASHVGQKNAKHPPLRGATEGTCSPTVTVDFCQEMTEKCTTEEQRRQDCP